MKHKLCPACGEDMLIAYIRTIQSIPLVILEDGTYALETSYEIETEIQEPSEPYCMACNYNNPNFTT